MSLAGSVASIARGSGICYAVIRIAASGTPVDPSSPLHARPATSAKLENEFAIDMAMIRTDGSVRGLHNVGGEAGEGLEPGTTRPDRENPMSKYEEVRIEGVLVWRQARQSRCSCLECPAQRKCRIVGVKIAGIGRSHK